MALTAKQTKQLLARARMQRARVHLGMNGVQPNVIALMKQAFDGTCVRPTPSDVVRVKVHPTFTGSIEEAVAQLSEASGSQFIKQEGEFLIFWKPNDSDAT